MDLKAREAFFLCLKTIAVPDCVCGCFLCEKLSRREGHLNNFVSYTSFMYISSDFEMTDSSEK